MIVIIRILSLALLMALANDPWHNALAADAYNPEHAQGRETGLKIPRFVTLKADKTNMRKGPGTRYPITWIYLQKHYPLQVVDEFEHWRKLRDFDGSEGWVNEHLITGRRYATVIKNHFKRPPQSYSIPTEQMVFLRYPDEESHPVARLELGTNILLKQCSLEWCKAEAAKHTGWIRKSNLWGIFPEELF
jgi:SH3-like domain-containing protein